MVDHAVCSNWICKSNSSNPVSHPHFLHLLTCWFVFVALAFFQGSPFSGHPFFRASLLQGGPGTSGSFIPPSSKRAPHPPPILQVSFSPAFPAHIAPDPPLRVIQVPPPKPPMAMRCGALQVLPVGLDFFHNIAWRSTAGRIQHIYFYFFICHAFAGCPCARLALLQGTTNPDLQLEPQKNSCRAIAGWMLTHVDAMHAPRETNKAYWLRFANLIGTDQ